MKIKKQLARAVTVLLVVACLSIPIVKADHPQWQLQGLWDWVITTGLKLQNSLGQSCQVGEVVVGMAADGNWVCEAPGSRCESNGGVLTEGGCWVALPGGSSGNDVCGYPDGYKGTYYSITGEQSADGCENPSNPTASSVCPDVAGVESGQRALNIIAALSLSPHSACTTTSCDGDCATNTISSDGVRGASLFCWDNQVRWARDRMELGGGIVRCRNFE